MERSPSELGAAIQSLLPLHQTMTLATAGTKGPWAAAVFYAHAGWEIYWVSSPESRHSQDLTADSRLAATIQRDDQAWQAIQGLQLQGEARSLGPALQAREALACIAAKFPYLQGAVGGAEALDATLAEKLAKVDMWRFRPRQICLIDNARGFGKRQTYDIE